MSAENTVEAKNKEFLSLFNYKEFPDYFDPVPFNKGFGFSIKRKYGSNVQRLLPEAEEDYQYVVLFHIFIEDEELVHANEKKALRIRAAMVVGAKKLMFPENPQINWPVERVSDDYRFDVKNKKFYRNGHEIESMIMLENVYQAHIKPCKLLLGLPSRSKKALLNFYSTLFVALSQALVFIAKILFNEKYTWNHARRAMETEYPKIFEKKEVEKVDSPKEDFFGFKASRWSLFMYCMFHLIGFFFLFFFPSYVDNFSFIKQIFTNPFLTVVYAFFTLCLYEQYLPLFFDLVIKKSTVYAQRIKERPLRI